MGFLCAVVEVSVRLPPPFMGISQRKLVIKTIRALYDSLQSHLDYAVEEKLMCPECGTRKFHAECVREYAESIKDLAALL